MAEPIAAEPEEAEKLAAADQRNVCGPSRVDGPVSFGVRHIAPCMAELHRASPALVAEMGLNYLTNFLH
jgi:DNA-binding transcriptional LysR family regulator